MQSEIMSNNRSADLFPDSLCHSSFREFFSCATTSPQLILIFSTISSPSCLFIWVHLGIRQRRRVVARCWRNGDFTAAAAAIVVVPSGVRDYEFFCLRRCRNTRVIFLVVRQPDKCNWSLVFWTRIRQNQNLSILLLFAYCYRVLQLHKRRTYKIIKKEKVL